MSVKAAQILDLRIRYGDFVAVENVSFNVARGTVLGILGGNGAGKSSTMKAIAGLNPPASGSILIDDYDITNPTQTEKARSVLGYCPDVGGLIRQATIREHIQLCLLTRGELRRIDEALFMVEDFGLQDFLDMPTVGFSHGMSRRLSCLLAFLGAKDLLILDEPFDGVDPIGVETIMRYIEKTRNTGAGVIISTHLMNLLAEASNDIMVMVNGSKVYEDKASSFDGSEGVTKYSDLLKEYSFK